MAVGLTTIKTTGRLVFDLLRDEETTSRTIDIPYPKDDESVVQSAINSISSYFMDSTNGMNTCMQPANWRDNNDAEQQWTTTGVRYEIVTTTTTPITPDEPETLGSAQRESEEQQEEQQEEQR